MKFRTEIEPVKTRHSIGIDQPLLMLGSCFTDNVGQRLAIDGFDVLHNPLGPLYNPMSLAQCIRRAFAGQYYTEVDLVPGPRGWHCLDYASRYSGEDAAELLTRLNRDFGTVVDRLANPRLHTLIVTFGSSYVFERQGAVVGNCHKFPATEFRRRRLSVKEIVDTWATMVGSLPDNIDIIFTVSPIRHLADGLHGNEVSKATLLLALEELYPHYPLRAGYFPSYEIMLDDLRDYRFYAADMKHPSEVAVDYIYDIFTNTYVTEKDRAAALENRRRYRASQHHQIL